ncbi:MAG: hypothetical protein IPJ49_21215 [Candidatus Obscuribacter sp.]|nr:hypothetical protein [Candidatus Obscuribacter sp.]
MTTYLLSNLEDERREKLVAAGIQLFDYDASSNSYLLEEHNRDRALEVLNCTAKENDTDYEGIIALKLKARKAPKEVVEPPPPNAEDLAKRAKSRERYIKACGNRMQELLISAREALTQRAKKVPAVQNQFFAAARASFILENSGANANQTAFAELLKEEFKRVEAVEKVVSARLSGNNLCIKTSELRVKISDSDQRIIGAFLIVINLDGADSGIRWFNSDRRVDGASPGMNAPYVFATGEPAVSEIRETMMELLARLELSVVAELAIQFVENIYDDEFGKYIHQWPLYREPAAPSGDDQNIPGVDRYGEGLDRFLPNRRNNRRSPRWT